MPVEIEKAVPIPDGRRKYPWESMDKGDSFLIPAGCASEKAKIPASMYALAGKAGKRLDRKYAARMVAEGVRVWRVK